MPLSQVDSRTRVLPSSSWISSGSHVGLWSNPSESGFEGFRGRLNQSRSGSSSGIHSLIACQGGSIGSMVSMSKGGGGGRGSVKIPSQRPWRRRKNSISLAADDFADGFHGALAAGALERVAAPNLEDEVAPEGAHVAGGLSRWCGDEEDLGGRRFFGQRLEINCKAYNYECHPLRHSSLPRWKLRLADNRR